MSQAKTLKVRATLFFILVGGVLAMAAVVTDHWAVLSPHLEHHNETCEAAHFGLWRICTTRVAAVLDKEDKSCEHVTASGGKVPIFPPFHIVCPSKKPQDRLPVGTESLLASPARKQPGVVFMARAKMENEDICLQIHLVRPGFFTLCELLSSELRDSRNCWTTDQEHLSPEAGTRMVLSGISIH